MKLKEGNTVGNRFLPGETGNKLGRPPKMPNLDRYLAHLLKEKEGDETAIMQILRQLVEQAKQGNLRAIEMLLDRAYGKPKQTIGGGPDAPLFGGPISLVFESGGAQPITSEQQILELLKEAENL